MAAEPVRNSARAIPSLCVESRLAASLSAIALAALFYGFIASGLHQMNEGHFQAFKTYYGAASALREGYDPYQRIHAYPYVYPPFYAFACQPLTHLSLRGAARVMLLINAALLFASLLAAAWAMRERLALTASARVIWSIALVTALVVSFPIYKELRGMQSNAVLVFGLASALVCLDRRPILAGCALALGIIIKYLPLIVVPYLLLRRRWTAAAATALATLILSLLPALSVGWSTNLRYLAKANGGLSRVAGANARGTSSRVHGMTDYLNISVTSTLSRLAADWGFRESAGFAMALFVIGLCGGWLALAYRRRDLPLISWPLASAQIAQPYKGLVGLEWAALVVGMVAFAPNGELVFSVLPATILSVLLLFPLNPRDWRISVFALVLMLIAVMLPIAAMGRPGTMLWNLFGATCWLLLASFAIICFLVLKRSPGSRLRRGFELQER